MGEACQGEWTSLKSKCACPCYTNATTEYTSQRYVCLPHYWDQTQKTHTHTKLKSQRKVHRISKRLHSSVNDGPPWAPSGKRSSRRLQSDLAHQSHTRGVTFLPTGWLTGARLLFSFPFFEEWQPKFPSVWCKKYCISSMKDNDPGYCQ